MKNLAEGKRHRRSTATPVYSVSVRHKIIYYYERLCEFQIYLGVVGRYLRLKLARREVYPHAHLTGPLL